MTGPGRRDVAHVDEAVHGLAPAVLQVAQDGQGGQD